MKSKKNKINLLLVLLTIMTISACAGNKQLTVDSSWARVGIQGNTSAAYFKVTNPLDQNDKLVSADSDIAEATEIHLSSMVDGTMKMQKLEFVEIPGKGMVVFKPKGLHIMFVNLDKDLNVGDTFQLRLFFENAGQINITVEVKEDEM